MPETPEITAATEDFVELLGVLDEILKLRDWEMDLRMVLDGLETVSQPLNGVEEVAQTALPEQITSDVSQEESPVMGSPDPVLADDLQKPQPTTLTLEEVLEGAERAQQRVSTWPEWKRELSASHLEDETDKLLSTPSDLLDGQPSGPVEVLQPAGLPNPVMTVADTIEPLEDKEATDLSEAETGTASFEEKATEQDTPETSGLTSEEFQRISDESVAFEERYGALDLVGPASAFPSRTQDAEVLVGPVVLEGSTFEDNPLNALLAEKTTLQRLLDVTPAEAVIDRLSLDARLRNANDRLEQLKVK